MFRVRRLLVLTSAVIYLAASPASGQLAGSRAGLDGQPPGLVADLPRLERDIAEGFITVEGRVETTLAPNQIRIVLAVTSEGETARQCRMSIGEAISNVREAWTAMNIPADRIVEDFIAVLPRYEWSIRQREGVESGIEQRVGYRMQTNLHLAVDSPEQAQRALDRAFEFGITDILGFDYWSKDLDRVKGEVRKQALDVARAKAETLFRDVFAEAPRPINIQEQTTVHYPDSLYHSFTNTQSQDVTPPYRRDIPFISAHRPANTYYRGLTSGADVQPGTLPMQPQISVVSTVRIYYESPAAEGKQKTRRRDKKRKDKSNTAYPDSVQRTVY